MQLARAVAVLEDDLGEVAVDLMGRIKRALDPDGLLNPGKVFPQRAGATHGGFLTALPSLEGLTIPGAMETVAVEVSEAPSRAASSTGRRRVGDMLAMLVGFLLASRLPAWVTVVLLIATEVILLALIRDNLTLNIIMLIHPVDWIKQWQMSG